MKFIMKFVAIVLIANVVFFMGFMVWLIYSVLTPAMKSSNLSITELFCGADNQKVTNFNHSIDEQSSKLGHEASKSLFNSIRFLFPSTQNTIKTYSEPLSKERIDQLEKENDQKTEELSKQALQKALDDMKK